MNTESNGPSRTDICTQASKKPNEFDVRNFNGIASSPVYQNFTDSAVFLVGPTGAMGEPLSIYSTADRRGG